MAGKRKKKTKRSKEKYPYLEKRLNSRVRQEYLDFDYINQLSDEEKEFLNKFAGEYYGGSFKKDGTDITATDKEGYRESYGRNNARNRCLYGQIRNKVSRTKLLNYEKVRNMVEEECVRETSSDSVEDAFIEYLDSKNVNNGFDNGENNGDPS